MESHLLIDIRPEAVIDEIDKLLSICTYPLLKVDYLISQARLSFKEKNYHKYLLIAHAILGDHFESSIEIKIVQYRKLLFLEFIISFYFTNTDDDLLPMLEKILQINKQYNFIDNNSLFYYILSHLTRGQLQVAKSALESEKKFFKGDGADLQNFLWAFYYYKDSQDKRSIKLLSKLNYSSNYFIALFSRILNIKIELRNKNFYLASSMIYNAERMVQRNKDKYLVYENSLWALKHFKKDVKSKSKSILEPDRITQNSHYLQFLLC